MIEEAGGSFKMFFFIWDLTRHSQAGSYLASPQSHLKFLSMEVKLRASNLTGALDNGTHSHHIYSFWGKKFSPECLTQNSVTKISMALRPARVDQLSPTWSNANDIVLSSKASRKDVGTISRILEKYSLRSGQLVNRNKSGIYFPSKASFKSRL